MMMDGKQGLAINAVLRSRGMIANDAESSRVFLLLHGLQSQGSSHHDPLGAPAPGGLVVPHSSGIIPPSGFSSHPITTPAWPPFHHHYYTLVV